MKSGTVNVLTLVLCVQLQLQLSCLCSSTSCTVVRYVQCMQQENSYCCRMCTAGKQQLISGVYGRKTANVVRRVQQDNSYCCQMCTAGQQLLLPVVCNRTSIPKACASFRQPVHLYHCVRPFVHLSLYVFLPTCL
jgi:hypothetical protein